MMRKSGVLAGSALLCLLLHGCGDDTPMEPPEGSPDQQLRQEVADLIQPDMAGPEADHPNQYIVVLKRTVDDPAVVALGLRAQHGGEVRRIWRNGFSGFVIDNLSAAAVQQIERHPAVDYVEKDRILPQDVTQSLTHPNEWTLDRVDTYELDLDDEYEYYFDGEGAHVYILDTGIYEDHEEFTDRLGDGYSALWPLYPDPYVDQDSIGHGTGVASVAGGTRVGIAKGATIHSVRVNLIGGASASAIIDGLEWVEENAQHPAVAVLSYQTTGPVADAMEDVHNAGVVMVTSAGNTSGDACLDPANQVEGVLAVAATTPSDDRRATSAYGSCVEVFAPGSPLAATPDGTDEYAPRTGTSFAAPLVAGLAAVIKAESHIWLSPTKVGQILLESATHDELGSIGAGSPNLLMNSIHRHAEIFGPIEVATAVDSTSATWESRVLGGNGTWAFTWEARVDGGDWEVVGTGTSYERAFAPLADYDLEPRLTGTSLGHAVTDSRTVRVRYSPDCGDPWIPC